MADHSPAEARIFELLDSIESKLDALIAEATPETQLRVASTELNHRRRLLEGTLKLFKGGAPS